jgi:hypothetical protein
MRHATHALSIAAALVSTGGCTSVIAGQARPDPRAIDTPAVATVPQLPDPAVDNARFISWLAQQGVDYSTTDAEIVTLARTGCAAIEGGVPAANITAILVDTGVVASQRDATVTVFGSVDIFCTEHLDLVMNALGE